ncbi:hypothetical protein [Amycolatopsis anabasis]|uniref:hypothetical protein n=1 Tax=Amycolatopsis anabasis TaxID=1840409 RepID=UPI00131AE6E3|nr:hypothetical protein [Amycolatopsis anabasis]
MTPQRAPGQVKNRNNSSRPISENRTRGLEFLVGERLCHAYVELSGDHPGGLVAAGWPGAPPNRSTASGGE